MNLESSKGQEKPKSCPRDGICRKENRYRKVWLACLKNKTMNNVNNLNLKSKPWARKYTQCVSCGNTDKPQVKAEFLIFGAQFGGLG